jgi:hypothetical protein
MTPKVAREWWHNTKTAVFHAERGIATGGKRPPCVHLYPLKRERGYLWLIRHGWDWDDLDRAIKAGGITRLPFDRACRSALSALLRYKGREIKPANRVQR